MDVKKSKTIMRTITSNHPRFLTGGKGAMWGTNTFQLECGHQVTRKRSIPIPRKGKINCTDCQFLRGGGVRKLRNDNGTWTVQTWDEKNQKPKAEVRGATL